jgi:lipoprotein-releasing system permease protein
MYHFLIFDAFVLFLIFGRLASEKVRDIGVLRALGATPGGISGCFLAQGAFVAFFGLALGYPAAYGMISNINGICAFFGLDPFPQSSFLVTEIPTRPLFEMQGDVFVIALATMVAALLGALLPAWRAASLNPVECLRRD